MLGIHFGGAFIELVPWKGEVDWSIAPWGSWRMSGRSADYEAELEAECDPEAGTVLRAPTASSGLAAMCRDTFYGRATLTVWRRDGKGRRAPGPPLVDRAVASNAALEVGGGPWWAAWEGKARMEEPLRAALNLPFDLNGGLRQLPQELQPPGL